MGDQWKYDFTWDGNTCRQASGEVNQAFQRFFSATHFLPTFMIVCSSGSVYYCSDFSTLEGIAEDSPLRKVRTLRLNIASKFFTALLEKEVYSGGTGEYLRSLPECLAQYFPQDADINNLHTFHGKSCNQGKHHGKDSQSAAGEWGSDSIYKEASAHASWEKENEQHGKGVQMDSDWYFMEKTPQGNYHGKDSKSRAKGGPKESSGSGPAVSKGSHGKEATQGER
jgi:hypothetical protein